MTATILRKMSDHFGHPIRHWRFTCLLWMTVVLIVVGVVIWEEVLEDRFFPKRWGVVEAGRIYRSGLLHEDLVKRTLEKHNIRVVISLINEDRNSAEQNAERAAASELGIERLVFSLDGDGRGEIDRYAGAVAAIARSRREIKPVLVHCAAGSNRTGGVVCMYHLLVEKKPPSEAAAQMRKYGCNLKRKPKLLDFLNDNMGEIGKILVEMKVLDQVPDPLPKLKP